MKSLKIVLLLVWALAATSCEPLLDEILYGHQEANCEVVHQSAINKITEGRAVMDVKVKNKGELDACDLTVYATLKKGDATIEKQNAYIGYLSSRSSETVSFTFTKIIYGSEYDDVDITLWYSEVEREDYDDDDSW